MEVPVGHSEGMTLTPTTTFLEGPQVHGWGQALAGDAFLTCNIGSSPLGVTPSPTSKSCLLSEPPFSAERQGGPIQPLPGRGARGRQCSWPVRVDKLASGLEDELRVDSGAVSLTLSCLSRMAPSGVPF